MITQASPYSWQQLREPIAIVAGSRATWKNAVWELEVRLGSDSLGALSHRMPPSAVSSIG